MGVKAGAILEAGRNDAVRRCRQGQRADTNVVSSLFLVLLLLVALASLVTPSYSSTTLYVSTESFIQMTACDNRGSVCCHGLTW